jgi:ESS family glutamate:Na+ symporter
MSVNLPAFSVTRNKPYLFWVAVAISAFYLLASFASYLIIAKKRAFAQKGKLFYTEGE